ncbi:MAG: hypothetical protein ABJA18_11740 [bacterium]
MQFISWISERWRSGYRFRIVVIAAFVILLVTLLYPFQTTTVPQWNLRVIDDAGAPVREINVTEHWQDYLLEPDGHEELQSTNQGGLVSFETRNIRASIVRRLFAQISKFGSRDHRGRPVRYGAVVVWGKKEYETTVAVYQGDVPPAEISVQRLR